jgi:hypothetical protein
MRIGNITFRSALELGPVGDDGFVQYKSLSTLSPSKGPGVYALVKNRKTVLYIGSYQSGIIKRWGYKRILRIYHFKHDRIRDILNEHQLRVYAENEDKIKTELGMKNNPWVNAHGIEFELIRKLKPPWNRRGIV